MALELPIPAGELADRLLSWYGQNRRDLPWRRSRDPYAIWLSEVMLQQTQVATVLPFYRRFLERYPTLEELARAEEREVLTLWAGLGYYSRARNLRLSAQLVCERYGGGFPTDFKQAVSLPGVGAYTAGAVLSIAYNQPYPVLDGNVRRFFSRLLALGAGPGAGPARLRLLLEGTVRHPGVAPHIRDFNQALMELGALVCTPRTPRCKDCPVADACRARQQSLQEALPGPVRRRAVEHVEATLAVIRKGDRYLLRRRPETPNLGLWDFPSLLGPPEGTGPERFGQLHRLHIKFERVLPPIRHQITFRRFRFTPVLARLQKPEPPEFRWVLPGQDGFPTTACVTKVIRALKASGAGF